jgi:hypothetical protein
MVFETADPHLDKQINTHFTAVAAYLEKQVSLIFNYSQNFSCRLGRNINTSPINDTL